MIRLLFFIILLFAAIAFGLAIKNDPGYMLLAFHHWTMEMPLWLGIALIILVFLITYWLIRFIACLCGIPTRVRFWSNRRKQRKAQQKTNRGLMALAEGNFAAAEKLLQTAAQSSENSLINYLGCARAAQARGAYERRDNYLRLAIKENPDAKIAVGLTQAELQLEKQQLEQALATLKHLREIVPHHKYVLLLLQQLYVRLKDWQSLQELLPALKKYHVLNEQELQDLTLKVAQQRIELAIKNQQDASLLWKELPRSLRHDPSLVASYVPYLTNTKQDDQAEDLLRDTLKKHWDEKCLNLYADLENIDSKKQLAQAEHWLKYYKNDAQLLSVLGKLCLKNQLWGKARSYFEASIAIKPSVTTYEELAKLYEKLGDTRLALETYRKALEM